MDFGILTEELQESSIKSASHKDSALALQFFYIFLENVRQLDDHKKADRYRNRRIP